MLSEAADPHWGWWIVFYFFLGGIAAGVYFTATLIDLSSGRSEDRDLARIGYWLAPPMISVCGVLLILDLDSPGRFWHMLFKSEVMQELLASDWPWSGSSWRLVAALPVFKFWSPMAAGAWALMLFGLCSTLSWLGALYREGRLARLLRHGILGRTIQVCGCLLGFFVAAYTGALLTATNQAVWSDTTWLGALFLTSAASTGLATLALMAKFQPGSDQATQGRLRSAERLILVMEMVALGLFVLSLSPIVAAVGLTVHGKILLILVPAGGMVLPFLLLMSRRRQAAILASVCVLAGGFLLRYSVLVVAIEAAALPFPQEAPSWPQVAISPEDGRILGEGTGADLGNRPGELSDLQPRSKLQLDEGDKP